MADFRSFSFDEVGVTGHGAGGELRAWRTLTGVEVQPPLRAALAEWEVTFFFSSGPPVFLVSGGAFAALAEALRLARRGAPPWCVFSPRAQLLLEGSAAAEDPMPSIPAVRARRAGRRTRAAWSMLLELRADPADEAALHVEELALAEESGRCPAAVLRTFESALLAAPGDAAAMATVTRLYLATDHAMAEPYAQRALPREQDRVVLTVAYARWLARRRREPEAEKILREALAGGDPLTMQALTAHQLALRHHLVHPRRARPFPRLAIGITAAILALVTFGVVAVKQWHRWEEAAAAQAEAAAEPHPDALKDLPKDGLPVVLERSPPSYPFWLRAKGVEGEVLVDFVIDDRGIPRNAYAVRSADPGFEAPAVAAVRQWRFRPGTRDGRRVSTHMQVPIVFALLPEPAAAEKKSSR